MKKIGGLFSCIIGLFLLVGGLSSHAADGVWTNKVSGVWSNPNNWQDGTAAGSGGIATINLTGNDFTISNDLGTVSLAGITLNSSLTGRTVFVSGGTNELVAPAVIKTADYSYLSFTGSKLSSTTNLLITGLGRLSLGQNNLLTGSTIISNGNVMAINDSAFGPPLGALRTDAIILDGGGLMNDANNVALTISTNRGITVTGQGGYLGCGYNNARTEINSPITGTGFLGINYEFSKVVLGNSANNYTGGTRIGTQGPGANAGQSATLVLNDNEVLPDAGGLIIGGETTLSNALPSGVLDLNGKTESVDTLSSGARATIASSVANQGRLIIGSQNGNSDFSGTIINGATLEKQGSGILNVKGAALTDAGILDLRGGTLQAGGPNLSKTPLLLKGGDLTIVAPGKPYELAAGADNVLTARLLLETNTTLTVDGAAGGFVFAGVVMTNSVQIPEPTLTINNNGAPVRFGATNLLSPAVLDADVASSAGLTLTNNVWLRRTPSASYTVATAANLFLDGNDLLGGALTLSTYGATIVANTTIGGDGSATVLNGNTLAFNTLQFTNSTFQDLPGNLLNVSNDFALTASTALFTGKGSITYSGDFTGTGTVEKRGTGTTELSGTGSALTGNIVIYEGALVAGSETVLGGAGVTLSGGTLSNKDGNNLTLSSTPVTAQSGALNVTADDTLTVNSQITGAGLISKTGAGALILGGTASNGLSLAVSAGTLELNKTGAADGVAVNSLSMASGTSVKLTGSNGNQIGGDLLLDGATLDLNGKNEALSALAATGSNGLVVNNGAAATLSVGEGNRSSVFAGTLTNGTGVLNLTKVGAGSLTMGVSSMAYSGATAVDAGTVRLLRKALPVTSGLAYQLDAANSASITLSGSNVAAWADSTSAGVDFSQGTFLQQPTYVQNAINGLPAVKFSDSARNRMAASKVITAQTVFIVAKTTSYGGLDGIWGRNGGDHGIRGASLGAWSHPGNGGDFTQSGSMYINGVAGSTYKSVDPYILTAVRGTPDTGFSQAIGDYWNDGANPRYFRGYIGEVLVYNRTLSVAERQAVEAYLADKWSPFPLGLSYRLDASNVSTIGLSGNQVTNWLDSSSAGVNFSQPTDAQRPTYVENAINGRPAVRFSDTARNRMVANKDANAQTVFIVAKTTTYGSLDGIWGQSGQDNGIRADSLTLWQHPGNGATWSYAGSMYINGVAGNTYDNTKPYILTSIRGSAWSMTQAIGDYWNSGTYQRYFRGYIGEILVFDRVLTTADREKVNEYLSEKWLAIETQPKAVSSTPVTLASGAQLTISDMTLALNTLAGTGRLHLEYSEAVITNYAGFTGTVIGNGTVALASPTGVDALFTPMSLGVNVVNNGALPAKLVVGGTGTNFFIVGSLADGKSALGLTHSGSGTTYMSGLNSTYTGPTTISGGIASIGGTVFTKYVRFLPKMMRSSTDNPNSGYQLSEFHLMLNGQKVNYPVGTLGTSPGKVAGAEGPEKAIDGSTSTKFYINTTPIYPLVVTLPSPMLFDGYRWYTANDSTGRDPVVWTVDISADGVTWTTVDLRDYSANQAAITTARYSLAGSWRMGDVTNMNVLSDLSATTISSPAELAIVGARETVGSLSGNGTITLTSGTLGINAFTNAAFTGACTGSGTLIKTGSWKQTLSGALNVSGSIVVEAGVLDLQGAVLTGITNIVIKTGAELTGSATVNGNLTMTFEGGKYSATLAVSGSLKTVGTVNLTKPQGMSYPLTLLLFTYASADAATQDALTNAGLTPTPPPASIVKVRLTSTSATLIVAPQGTLIQIR